MTPMLLTQKQAAERMGMSVPMFVRYVRPHVKKVLVGGDRRYPVKELEQWVDTRCVSL